MLPIVVRCLKLLMASSNVMLRSLCMLLHVATTHMHLDHFLNLRVVKSLSHFVDFDFDKLGCIIILILCRHSFSLFKLSDMNPEIPHPINVFFDFLSIVEAFLKHSFLFDLLKDAQLGDDFRVHAAVFEIRRLCNLRWSLSLLTT